MSGMTVNRSQPARANRPHRSKHGPATRSGRGLATYFVISTAVLIALGYWAVKQIDGWASLIVLGMILVNVVGPMIAVRPNRGAPQG